MRDHPQDASTTSVIRRGLLILAFGSLVGLGVLFLTAFFWPGRPITLSTVDFGGVESFTAGTVTTFRLREGDRAPTRLPLDAPHARTCTRSSDTFVHVVRLDDGSFRALSAVSPHLGEVLPWLPDFVWDGEFGWFRDLCHGETFRMDGTRIFGPSPRDMDWYPVSIEGGQVLVDLGDLQQGARGTRGSPGTPAPAGVELTGTATAPASSQ